MFAAPQITSTAIVAAPKRFGAANRGSLPYTLMYETTPVSKLTAETTVDGTAPMDKDTFSKRFIGVTLSETLNESGTLACTVQLSGSTIVRLAGSSPGEDIAPSVGSGAGALQFGDVLYGTKNGEAASQRNQLRPAEPSQKTVVLDAMHLEKGNVTISGVTDSDPTEACGLLPNRIPVGRFISTLGVIDGHEYVNMLICRNPFRRLGATDGTQTQNAIWYEHPFTRSDTDAKGKCWNGPTAVLGQVRDNKVAKYCPTTHLSFLADSAFRPCIGLASSTNYTVSTYTSEPFAPPQPGTDRHYAASGPDWNTVPVIW